MPKVSAKKGRKPARKTARKPARKTTRRRRGRQPTFAERIREVAGAASAYAAALAIGAAAIAVAMLWAGGYFGQITDHASRMMRDTARDAGFAVARVTVKGRVHTSEDEILSALAVRKGASLLHFDAGAARARIEALGWVRSAAVARLWPDTVHVSIRERTPDAVWDMHGELALVDATGAVIDKVGAGEYPDLPIIIGAGAPEAAAEMLKALQGAPDVRSRVQALARIDDRRWDLRLTSGAVIRLPETGAESALAEIERLQTIHGTLDRPIEYIDLRNPDQVVTRPLADASRGR